MPLTEKEENSIMATGIYETPYEMIFEVRKAVARCENDARKDALIEIRELWNSCETASKFANELFALLEKEGLD